MRLDELVWTTHGTAPDGQIIRKAELRTPDGGYIRIWDDGPLVMCRYCVAYYPPNKQPVDHAWREISCLVELQCLINSYMEESHAAQGS